MKKMTKHTNFDAENAKKLICYMNFTKEDIDEGTNFFYECNCCSDTDGNVYYYFYRIIDELSVKYNVKIFDAPGIVEEKFNELITKLILNKYV